MGVTKQKKIAIISPYLSVLGGGERYILTIAENNSYTNNVTVFAHDLEILNKGSTKFNLNLKRVKVEKFPANLTLYLLKSRYDVIIYVTDGSLPFLPPGKNLLIIQSPLHIPDSSLITKLKLTTINSALCYSQFIKNIINNRLEIKTHVIPPPVDTLNLKPLTKQNYILSVGRFFTWLHSKKQDFLIDSFKKLIKKENSTGWTLKLVGSIDEGSQEYVQKLQISARGYPIEIITDVNYEKLKQLYGKAKIYWHGAGFGEDLSRYPEKAEHFGISTVEAMSAGCVPIVFNGGGQKEIVKNAVNGFLFNTQEQLLTQTLTLINNDELRKSISSICEDHSKIYSKKIFMDKINQLISSS